MNTLTLGIVVFVGFSAFVSTMMIMSLQRAKAEGLSGQALFSRLLPYIVIDGAFVIVFVLWLVTKL